MKKKKYVNSGTVSTVSTLIRADRLPLFCFTPTFLLLMIPSLIFMQVLWKTLEGVLSISGQQHEALYMFALIVHRPVN